MTGAPRRTDERAIKVAAKATGLRQDQIERAVSEYRAAANAIDAEPHWTMLSHIGSLGMSVVQYTADETGVILQVDSWKEKGNWKSERRYVFNGEPFEHYAEARSVELSEAARPRPYTV